MWSSFEVHTFCLQMPLWKLNDLCAVKSHIAVGMLTSLSHTQQLLFRKVKHTLWLLWWKENRQFFMQQRNVPKHICRSSEFSESLCGHTRCWPPCWCAWAVRFRQGLRHVWLLVAASGWAEHRHSHQSNSLPVRGSTMQWRCFILF